MKTKNICKFISESSFDKLDTHSFIYETNIPTMKQTSILKYNRIILVKNGNFISEPQTDFIFAIVGEELGFIGCIVALLLLTAIVVRIARTGKHDKVGNTKVMCYGVAGMIAGQVIINVGMCLMLLPVIGITLPFFSAGGSSNLCIYFSIGLIMSFYRYNQQREAIDVSLNNIDNPFMDI